ncbi:MAG: 7-carboxy-7-deazaguanine synthase QueE [Akkermansia sp.]|nr:7-carboxy-7-deazaguanine synthase QueE [Akkermansia sp.]
MNIARLNSAPEIFRSIQGEGTRMGAPSVFLRLAGCNLHCSWCDTKHSWPRGVDCAEEEVARLILSHNCPALVVTGGEPLLQQAALVRLLALLPPREQFFIEVETNGTLPPCPDLAQRVDQWNVSPKLAHSGNAAQAAIRPEVLARFAAMPNAWFKFVVTAEADWDAIEALQLPRERIILMPCAATRAELQAAQPAVAEICARHGVLLGRRLQIELWDDRKGV